MTALVLVARQANAEGFLEVGPVASVRLLADDQGRVVDDWWQTEVSIPVAGRYGPAGLPVEVPRAGYYRVTVSLPRRSDLIEEVGVADGEEVEVPIDLTLSPHEYLAWPQYAGVVGRPGRSRLGGTDAVAGGPIGDMLTSVRAREQRLRDTAPDLPTVSVADVAAGGGGWVQASRTGASLDDSFDGSPPAEWPSPMWDGEYAVWMATPERDQGADLVAGLRGDEPSDALRARFPRWLAFRTGDAVDLVSVPWAWFGAVREDDEGLEILFDRTRPNPVQTDRAGLVRVTVRDRRWLGLLEYLGAGSLGRAAQLVEPAIRDEYPDEMTGVPEAALFGKTKSPLVATAGAFVLVAGATSTERQYWDQWLDNLARWFPGIPDGAILLGCRRVEQARDQAALEQAFEQLVAGIDRGIPFLAATMRLAAVTLAQLADTVLGAEEQMRRIAGVSSRVDPDQPFTVIRLR